MKLMIFLFVTSTKNNKFSLMNKHSSGLSKIYEILMCNNVVVMSSTMVVMIDVLNGSFPVLR